MAHPNLGGSNRLLAVPEAASYLSTKPKTLRDNWRRWGVPAVRVGKGLRFRERDLENWTESKRESA